MVKVKEKQSIFDMTVQEFGQIDDVVKVSSDNDVSVSEILGTNRDLIIDAEGEGDNDIKKEIIEQGLSLNNNAVKIFDDWFLPSKDALDKMYVNLHLHAVGEFATDFYWSSSELVSIASWSQRFDTGGQISSNKVLTFYVRACRFFTDSIGAYSLRDIGPAVVVGYFIDIMEIYQWFNFKILLNYDHSSIHSNFFFSGFLPFLT